MNPFSLTSKVVVATTPVDMRAGIPRLSALVAASLGCDPQDGNLYVFVSRDAKRAKMLRFEQNGWVLYYVKLTSGIFRWSAGTDRPACLEVRRADLARFLQGLAR